MSPFQTGSACGPLLFAFAPDKPPFGMSETMWLLAQRGIKVAVTILAALLLLRLVHPIERRIVRWASQSSDERKGPTSTMFERRQRAETLTRVSSSVLRVIVWSLTFVLVLGNIGVEIAPLIAGAGIAGVAIGFGAQSIVKDMFAGFFILLENQYDVGDTITVANVTGTVERMTMRITVLRDPSGTLHFVPNSAITTVANRTEGWIKSSVDAIFAPAVSEEAARRVLSAAGQDATDRLKSDRILLEPIVVEGPAEFSATGITYKLAAKVRPDRALDARRAMISALVAHLAKAGFSTRDGALTVDARSVDARP